VILGTLHKGTRTATLTSEGWRCDDPEVLARLEQEVPTADMHWPGWGPLGLTQLQTAATLLGGWRVEYLLPLDTEPEPEDGKAH